MACRLCGHKPTPDGQLCQPCKDAQAAAEKKLEEDLKKPRPKKEAR